MCFWPIKTHTGFRTTKNGMASTGVVVDNLPDYKQVTRVRVPISAKKSYFLDECVESLKGLSVANILIQNLSRPRKYYFVDH